MSSATIQQNNIGTIFRRTILDQDGNIVDVSSATTKEFIFTKPSDTRVIKSASFVNDGVSGVIQYTSTSGDLDEIGTWSYQAFIVFVSGEFYTDIDTFKVNRNL